MNTNQLKKFAQAARKKLLEQVGAKLEFVLNNDTPELREKAVVLRQLKDEVDRHTKDQIVDKIAYTWFNRFVALRFMDVNGYQPLGINIVTALPGQVSPQILQEAMAGNIASDLKVNKQKVFGLLDGKVKSTNTENDAYRLLLIAACNHLHRIFPFLFEQIDDYTELLLPDDLTSQFSLLHDVVEGITEEDGKQVECIGWLYQFYISERKDEVFASKEKVKKEDIPAATQLFTPRWIVEYMVQNTVGKIWMMNYPASSLRQHMPYYIESEATTTGDYLKIDSPEELPLLDQACGSGHILVYGFELLYRIYEEQGYNTSEIPALIIRHNLHGMEIDERAAQLSSLAILMKAREYQPRLFKKAEVPVPNITCYEDLALTNDEIKAIFGDATIKLSDELLHDLTNMQQATNLGSLIIPHSRQEELAKIKEQISKAIPAADLYNRRNLEQVAKAIDTLVTLTTKYCCVVDNPPYMGVGNANKNLGDYVKLNYPDSKADLMACFMEAGLYALKDKGMVGMINQHTWMFLGSYEALRKKLTVNYQFDTLLHLGPRTFPEIGGEVVQNAAFTFFKQHHSKQSHYVRLVHFDSSNLKREKTIEAIKNNECKWRYTVDQKAFSGISGNPIGYWVSTNGLNSFQKHKPLGEEFIVRSGIMTGDDMRFLRYWYEINVNEIATNKESLEDVDYVNEKYLPMNKEEGFRKWSGRYKYVFRYDKGGQNLHSVQGLNFRLRDDKYYFKQGISWGDVAGNHTSYRWQEKGLVFSARAPMIITDKRYLIALLNSNIVSYFQAILNPTLSFNIVDLQRVPVANEIDNASITECINKCISISSLEWNSNILSLDFQSSELIRIKAQDVEEAYDLYRQYWNNKFYQLHESEEELNRQFINIYGLEGELTPEVSLDNITILKEETSIEDGKLVFNAWEVFAQFISYSVGCMFGRYSLDKEGLILASQGETMQDFFDKTGRDKITASFLPDADNIIPILDDEWFDDDIVACFYQFLKVSFGEKNFRKNLAFIEEQIGKDIRKYFVKDFYTDHIQRYKKRPIYWMFSSPKGYFNVLVYIHRYTPDTLNNILNNYLREFIEKLRNRTEHLKQVEISGSAAEKTKAVKEMEKISLMLTDCLDYERNILYPLAPSRISIDLDNGVLVNYNCFGKAVREVKGLNDTKTKNEVRKFDWIDTEMIQ